MGFWSDIFGGRNAPQSGKRLMKAMEARARRDDPASQRLFYEALLESTLIVPTAGPSDGVPQERWTALPESAELRLLGTQDDNQQPVLFAFTSSEALVAWNPKGGNYVAISAKDLFSTASQEDFASIYLDCPSQIGGVIAKEEFDLLADGRVPDCDGSGSPDQVSLGAGAKVMIGPPEDVFSDDLQNHLTTVLQRHTEISAGYVFQLLEGKNTMPVRVVGIQLSASAARENLEARICESVQSEIDPTQAGDSPIYVMAVGENTGLGDSVEECGQKILG